MRGSNVTTWVVAVVLAGGAAWAWRWRASTDVVRAEPVATTAPDALPTDLPEPERELQEMVERAAQYVPGEADEAELERFWESCEPVEAEHLEQLASELELRVRFFESLRTKYSNGPLPQPPALDGAVSQDEFLAYYSPIGIEEGLFLLEECVAGRMRRTPFFPIPPTTLDNTHPTVQLVPHLSPTLGSGFVARLESSAHQRLFDDRPVAYVIAKKALQEGGAAAAIHERAAQSEREAAAR